jgi:putative membrane protein
MNQLGSVWVWTFDPQELAPVLVLAALYAHRLQSLRRRGRRTSPWRVTSFTAGLAMLAVALASPIDWIGENRLFAIHMVQHVLLGDIAPLLIVAGLDGPLLRPLLVLPVLGRLRGLVHPLVALPLWAIDLYAWHLPGPYQAALRNDTIHAFEHACFFTFGLLLWAALLEPLPGPRWFGPEIKEDAGVPRVRANHAIRYGHADELLSRLPGAGLVGTRRIVVNYIVLRRNSEGTECR